MGELASTIPTNQWGITVLFALGGFAVSLILKIIPDFDFAKRL